MKKSPLLRSFIITLLFLLVISIGGAISSIAGISSKITLFAAYLIIAILLFLYIHSKNLWSFYGFSSNEKTQRKNIYLYIALFFIAIFPIIAGISSDLKFIDVIYILCFMLLVAFVEETIFRGIILKLLQKKSDFMAILGSSLLFSIPHILNALNGKEWGQTLFQIGFALVIGILLATLVIQTKNILPLITYHFLNNTVSSITTSAIEPSFALIINLVVFGMSIIFIVYLYLSNGTKKSRS